MSEQVLKVGLVQTECGSDPSQNLERALERIRRAAAQGARLVCLQELFHLPYFCQREEAARLDWAESVPGPTSRRLSELARKLEITLIAPLFERRAAGIYHNTVVLLGPDGALLGRYRKMHVPDDPFYHEKFYFTPGDLGFLCHPTPLARVGVLICWDQWFPEAARLTALQGAQIIFCPTAIGWLEGETEETRQTEQQAWETVQRGHAVANGVFWAAVNRVGREGSLTFWGDSFLCDPQGRLLASAGEDEEILLAECDLSLIEKVRRQWPFLRDRRIDAYADLGARFLD